MLMDLHHLISTFSYIAIFILMLSNGVANFPSSQLLYLIVGYYVSTGSLLFIPSVVAGALGNSIGNIITFLLVKKYDKPFARKLLMIDEKTFEKVHATLVTTFTKNGMWYIFVGKLIPSVKAFIPILAGLSHTQTVLTSCIFAIASMIWAIAIISLGYYFGEHVTLTSFSLVSLLVGGSILFILYRKFSKKHTL